MQPDFLKVDDGDRMSQDKPKKRQPSALLERLQTLTTSLGSVSSSIALAGVFGVIVGLVIINLIDEMRTFGNIVVVLSVFALTVSMIISYRTVRSTVVSRRGRYGANSIGMIIIVAGILIAVNFLAFENPNRFDTTFTKQLTLAPRTVQILEDLPENVKATGFFIETDRDQKEVRRRADDVLNEFKVMSGGNFDYQLIDSDAHPVTAKEYGVRVHQTVFFEGVESNNTWAVTLPLLRETGIPDVREEDFVTALLIVTGQERKPVYFITGHGEKDINDMAQDSEFGFGLAKQALQQELYEVIPLDFVTSTSIPKDAAAVIVAGPTKDLTEEEAAIFDTYLWQGGRLLMLLEPNTPASWNQLLLKWGIRVLPGYLLDPRSSRPQDPRIPVVKEHGPNDQVLLELREKADPEYSAFYQDLDSITANLAVTYYPGVSGLIPTEPKEQMDFIKFGEMAMPTIFSSVVSNPEQTEATQENLIVEIMELARGRVHTSIAAVVKASAPLREQPSSLAEQQTATIIVFGDSDFVNNKNFNSRSISSDNSDFFLNSVNWLAGDVNLIQIRPKIFTFRKLVLTQREYDFIRFTSWFLLPVALSLTATVVWWRRR